MMNKKKREKTTILSSAGEGEKEITWNSVINPKKTVVAVCSFYTDLSQMLVNSILNGVTKKSVVSPLEILLFDSFVSFIFFRIEQNKGSDCPESVAWIMEWMN